MPKPGPICPYCEGNPPSRLVDAGEVYGLSWAGRFSLWVCINFPACDAYVGTHKESANAEPIGTLANAELRKLRRQVHDLFDALWKGPAAKFKGRSARKKAYCWITDQMGIEGRQFHAAMADESECRKALMLLVESEVTTREK